MPLYDYKCTSCNAVREVLQRSGDQASVSCASCNAPMKKQLSAPSFRLKGAGWYETDFKSTGGRNLAGTADSSSDEGGKSTGAETSKAGSSSESAGKGGDQKKDSSASESTASSKVPA